MLKVLFMLKGINSNISARGQTFHIQTEDWGADNPYFVTTVFKNGAVLKVIKAAYNKSLGLETKAEQLNEQLKASLQLQHEQAVDLVLTNKI
jgi:hypothetical protein